MCVSDFLRAASLGLRTSYHRVKGEKRQVQGQLGVSSQRPGILPSCLGTGMRPTGRLSTSPGMFYVEVVLLFKK